MEGVLPPPGPARRAVGSILGLRHDGVAAVAWGFIALVVLASLGAPLIAPYDPNAPEANVLLGPGAPGHLLGTDNLGRDQLSRLLYGGRSLLAVSTAAVLIATMLGTAIGLVAGYRRKAVEVVLMRSMDALLSFPLILLGIMVVAALGSGPTNLMLAISIALVPIVARLVHGLALAEGRREYVLAARAAGMGPLRIMVREILPNLFGPIVVQATSLVALAAGFSTALSYLGLGITAPTPDWGLMVKDGQAYIANAPDLAVIPGVLITALLTAVTFAGDHLRDVLDPERRLRAATTAA